MTEKDVDIGRGVGRTAALRLIGMIAEIEPVLAGPHDYSQTRPEEREAALRHLEEAVAERNAEDLGAGADAITAEASDRHDPEHVARVASALVDGWAELATGLAVRLLDLRRGLGY